MIGPLNNGVIVVSNNQIIFKAHRYILFNVICQVLYVWGLFNTKSVAIFLHFPVQAWTSIAFNRFPQNASLLCFGIKRFMEHFGDINQLFTIEVILNVTFQKHHVKHKICIVCTLLWPLWDLLSNSDLLLKVQVAWLSYGPSSFNDFRVTDQEQVCRKQF